MQVASEAQQRVRLASNLSVDSSAMKTAAAEERVRAAERALMVKVEHELAIKKKEAQEASKRADALAQHAEMVRARTRSFVRDSGADRVEPSDAHLMALERLRRASEVLEGEVRAGKVSEEEELVAMTLSSVEHKGPGCRQVDKLDSRLATCSPREIPAK